MTPCNLFSLLPAFAYLCAAPVLYAQQTGLSYERWNNLPGNSVETLRGEGINVRLPDHSATVALAEAPSNVADAYGARLRGQLVAPATGDYTFFIAGDDNVELWLAQDFDGDPAFDTTAPWNRRLIAWHRGFTGSRQWNKFATQKSRIVRLLANESYSIEALVKEGGGGDNLAIGWHHSAPDPVFTSHDFQSPVSSSWQTQIDGSTDFSVISGDMFGSADRASFQAREWTGDGDFIIELSTFEAGHVFAKAGLMVREGTEAGARHAFVCRSWNGAGVSFQRRTATSGGTAVTHWDNTAWRWLRLVRAGNTITASASFDGQSWMKIGSATYASLAPTLQVGPAASSYNSTSVAGNFGPLEARPLVATEVIPGASLVPHSPHADDPLDRGLPDAWLASYGLDPLDRFGDNGPYGDPDGDGTSNLDEYRLGQDPTTPGTRPGGLTRERWTDLDGTRISDLTHNRSRFLSTPNERTHVPDIYEIDPSTDYGSRYRGMLNAPVTGWYRFWISGDDEAEFWFADGTVKLPTDLSLPVHHTTNPAVAPATNRYGKQLLASIRDERFGGDFTGEIHNFDQFPSQRSRAVFLTAGQAYYLEVLHKQGDGAGHIALAWQPPGEPREVLPPAVLSSEIPPLDDPDGDNLPSAWESLRGLDPLDNGLVSANDGQYADPDGDGLTNLLELQYGTNPLAADTDGDGLTDYDEIFHYGTDPLVSNDLVPTLAATPDLHQYTAATGSWSTNVDGSLSAADRRGEITYTFTVAQPGIHEIAITGAAIGSVRPVENLPLVLSIDGNTIGNAELVSVNAQPGTVRTNTPLLAAGTHTLAILHDNYRSARRLRIDSITIHRLGGTDLDENQIPDWADQSALAANALSRVPATSLTSPVSIEGRSQNLSIASLDFIPYGDTENTPLVLIPSINDTFFTDVPLSENGPVTLTANFLGNLVATDSRTITWLPTNLFEFDQRELHIRKGDALRLDAYSSPMSDGQPFQVFLNGQSLTLFNQSNPPDAAQLVSGGWGNYRGFSIRFNDAALSSDSGIQPGDPMLLQQLVIRRAATASGTVPGDPANAILKIYTSQTPSTATWVADSINVVDVRGGLSETNLTFAFPSVALDPNVQYWFHFANTPGDLPIEQVTWTNARLRVSNHASHTFSSGNLVSGTWGNQDTAWDPLLAATFAHSVALQDENENTTHSSGSPFAAIFATPGSHTLTATHGGQSATVTVQVHAADFGTPHSVRAYSPRSWTPPLLDPSHLVEADDRLTFAETTATPGPRTFHTAVHQAGNRHVIARLPAEVDGAPAAILARGTVHGFYLAYLDETTDPEIVHRYDDGTWLMSSTMVAVNLPADILIRLTSILQGTVFPDGDSTLWLDSSHFDANGIATIYSEWAGSGSPRLCNRLHLFLQP